MTNLASTGPAIAANLDAVRRRIRDACNRSDRDPGSVTLVGVTKTVPAERVRRAIDAGLRDIGENYVREGALKRAEVAADLAPVRWHLIGHLQSNKIRDAIEAFDLIHSVDSVRLAEAISRRAQSMVPMLLEVNVSGDPSKFGLAPAEVAAAVRSISCLANLDLRGLMTVAPDGPDDAVRQVFRELRLLAEANGLPDLSMGMSGDFEAAIEEGATLVRIGRAIFGERPR